MQKQSKTVLGGGRRKNSGGPRFQVAQPHPPPLRPAFSLSKTFRFQATGAVTYESITQTNLSNLIVVALTATTSAKVFSSARLRKVEAWCAPAQGGAGAEIQIVGPNTSPGPENRKSDISMGIQPAHVRWNPVPNSTPDFWFSQAGSAEMFQLTCPTDTVVDVTLDLILNFSETATAGPVPVGATPGEWYAVPLDGLGNNLPPVDWTVLP